MNDSDKERKTITFSPIFSIWFTKKGPKERGYRKTEEIRNLFLGFFKG